MGSQLTGHTLSVIVPLLLLLLVQRRSIADLQDFISSNKKDYVSSGACVSGTVCLTNMQLCCGHTCLSALAAAANLTQLCQGIAVPTE